MKKLGLYYKRFKVMSPKEIAWRMRSLLRNNTDKFLVSRRQQIRKPSVFLNGDETDEETCFLMNEITAGDGEWLKINNESGKQWYNSLLARAERIIEHRLDFLGLNGKYLGDPIIWNRDHKRDQDTPMTFSASLDCWDIDKVGDCRFVWELNRHHQLVVLGQAWRLSGDVRFAKEVAEQLYSWLKQNPYGVGMNWRSGLELGIRLINWTWALDLIKKSGVIDDQIRYRILDSISRHIWEIDRKYSRGSSVNNHLIGEAAGVFVAISYFHNLRNASKWLARSQAILNREILSQTFPDGGNIEQSLGYLLFTLQFFVAAGIAARASGRDFPESYWSRLEKMFEFLGILSEGGAALSAFGDCDDGYVLDIGNNPRNFRGWMAVGAALFGRNDFKAWAGGYAESIEWLLGKQGRQHFKAISEHKNNIITSRAFENSGYYLLQNGKFDSQDRISIIFDCGPLGMEPLAGHGHADALNFTLRAFGVDILVDPGTYDYFCYPKWREYFRGTRAHNTVVIDGQDQSEMLGPFLWGRKAKSECLSWQPSEVGGKVIGQHDGYTKLDEPVIHKRMLDLDDRELVIRDDIISKGLHKIEMFFHLTDQCVVNPASKNRYIVYLNSGMIEIDLDHCLKVESFNGSEDPICGWISRGYHQKEASTTLVGRCIGKGNTCLVSRINISKLNSDFPYEAVQKIRKLIV